MASIRRTDIMHKKYSKSRPAKSERERIYKRLEAYKWRDARRVHLAGSFDRWRKLQSSLKLKDSSLAWHLMEAHEKGHCTFCRHCNFQSAKEREKQRRKCDQKDFLPSLIASVRQLCYAHFDFNERIEIVGLLCLEFDNARKENFSLNECIRSDFKSDNLCYVSVSNQKLPVYSMQETSLSLSHAQLPEMHQLDVSEHEPKNAPVSSPCSAISTNTDLSTNVGLLETLQQKIETSDEQNINVLCAASSGPNMPLDNLLPGSLGSLAPSILKSIVNNTCSGDTAIKSDLAMGTSCSPQQTGYSDGTRVTFQHKEGREHKLMDSSLCSESDPSLEIDIEKMDTSIEEDNTIQTSQAANHHLLSSTLKSDACHESLLETLPLVSNDLDNLHTSGREISQCNKGNLLPSTKCKLDDVPTFHLVKSEDIDLPLDMSVLKSNVKKEIDASTSSHSVHDCSSNPSPQNYSGSEGANLESLHFSSSGKRKISEINNTLSQSSRQSPFWLENFQSLPGKMKEEGHASIPWQRRDMSRKEEYEFLEMNPFSDLADFSQHYPHVHQRTYYRWKRRIKEEYIILEQCPGMSFQEFSSVVLQAKESVFCHWKSLIAQGKGFFAPSDTSKRLETKCPTKPSSHNSAYAFMQKNLTFTYEQFCQQYPGTSVDVFSVLKRKAMQEFWLYNQNQHMSHKDFSKLVNVSEDVFSTWKKYAECFRPNTFSPNLKAVSSSMSPNSHASHPSFHSLDSSHSSTADLQFQSVKDGHFSMKDSSKVFKESKATAHAGALNSQLNDSAARSLSTSYLASLQNMMFPWHSYYGMPSSLGQQMLPMMLWPGMMGLAGGLTSSLGLMSSSHADAASKSSGVTGLYNSLLGTTSESTESMKSDESQSSHSDEHVNSIKRSGSGDSQEQSRNQVSSDGEKKMKMSSDKDDVDFLGSVSRSRKQNKQEYIYYLKNPELCFKELESLFPSISLRTFYRWRKEMNAAVLLLEGNKNMTFHQFQMVFPDIPEDIFESWKERVGTGMSPTIDRQSQQSTESDELNCSDQTIYFNEKKSTEKAKSLENNMVHLTDSHFSHSPVTSGSQPNGAHLRKNVTDGYLYLQKNPHIDFASFSKLYPDTSVRSFYRWKKELKDAIDFLKANPAMAYDAYRAVDATVCEDIFNMWKTLALANQVFKEEISEDSISAEEREASMPNHCNNKLNSPEYCFLQLNPYIEFCQFALNYPDVPKHTFYRWKQEIQKIMNYIQTEPSFEFADIASVLPQVSEQAFDKWKQAVATETESPIDTKDAVEGLNTEVVTRTSEVDEHNKNNMTEALLYLMHNPTITYNQFKGQFDFVSAATFELWLKRIKTVILYIASNPSIEYTAFSTSIKDVAKDIFEMWKNFNVDEIAALEIGCEEAITEDLAIESRIISDDHSVVLNKEKDYSLEAFEFCQKNPKVVFATFQTTYPTISEKLFSDWMSRIQEELQYIRGNPDLHFKDFAKVYPHIRQDIFDLWKSVNSGRQSQLLQVSSDEAMEEDIVTEENSIEKDLKHRIFSDKATSSEIMDSVQHQKDGNETFRKPHAEDYVKDNDVSSLSDNESLDNRTKESSLSKLAKFADSSTPAYTKKYLARKLSSSFEHLLKNNNNKAMKLEPVFSSSDEDNFLNDSDASVSAHHLHSTMSHASDMEVGEVYCASPLTTPLHTSSLSALMAMSRSDDTHSRGNLASPQKERSGHNVPLLCSGNLNWQRTNNEPGAFGCGGVIKDDDEAFSSQRQKKMSRAEYLFVKDNPDVDSQEFSRIFPGVSARTFYRWKKEIKAQLHLA